MYHVVHKLYLNKVHYRLKKNKTDSRLPGSNRDLGQEPLSSCLGAFAFAGLCQEGPSADSPRLTLHLPQLFARTSLLPVGVG